MWTKSEERKSDIKKLTGENDILSQFGIGMLLQLPAVAVLAARLPLSEQGMVQVT